MGRITENKEKYKENLVQFEYEEHDYKGNLPKNCHSMILLQIKGQINDRNHQQWAGMGIFSFKGLF